MQIIDFFPYFDPTGVELLQLRISILQNHVDKFIICESNRTHSGIPIQFKLKQRIQELNLPSEKIEVVELNIPEDNELQIELIDIFNCYENNKNQESIRARARERLQKDAILKVLNNYSDHTLFLISDSDEIINPKYLNWLSETVIYHQNVIIKVPLVHLEGAANLRVYRTDNNPKLWDRGMFMCTKQQLLKATPSQIRSNVDNPFSICYLHQSGKREEDMGWHFSWMGGAEKLAIKRQAFTHYNDTFSNILGNSYSGSSIAQLHNQTIEPGKISPSGEIDTVLKLYSEDLLPAEIFDNTAVRDYLLPHYNNEPSVATDLLKSLINNSDSVAELVVEDNLATISKFIENSTKEYHIFNNCDSINNIDLLLVESIHTYTSLKEALNNINSKVNKYVIIKNTQVFGTKDKNKHSGKGLLPAIIEFVIDNPEWYFKYHKTVDNGFTVLEKILPL